MSDGRPRTLDALAPGGLASVIGLTVPADRPEWARQLADLGFLPGETVRLLHRAPFGGDPMVVRVGGSTYALRRAEAACVQLGPAPA